MKKGLAMVVAIVLVVVLLAACAPTGTNATNAGVNTAPVPSASEAAPATSAAAPASPAAAATDLSKIVIGASYQDLANQYIKQLQLAIQAEAKKLGVTVIDSDGQGDPAKQVAAMENFIAQGVNAVILDPYDKDATIPGAQKVAAAGIPIIGLCAHLSDESMLTSFVGSHDVQAGELAMQAIADKLGGKGNIAIVQGHLGISAQVDRDQGYQNILDKYPDMKVIFKDTGDWSTDKTLALVENWLQSGKQIDAIAAENDEEALGAYQAVKAAGMEGKIIITGVDAIADAVQAVKDGKLLATVLQNSTTQGTVSLDIAVAAALGKTVDKEYPVPFQLIDSTNVDKFLYVADGTAPSLDTTGLNIPALN